MLMTTTVLTVKRSNCISLITATVCRKRSPNTSFSKDLNAWLFWDGGPVIPKRFHLRSPKIRCPMCRPLIRRILRILKRHLTIFSLQRTTRATPVPRLRPGLTRSGPSIRITAKENQSLSVLTIPQFRIATLPSRLSRTRPSFWALRLALIRT